MITRRQFGLGALGAAMFAPLSKALRFARGVADRDVLAVSDVAEPLPGAAVAVANTLDRKSNEGAGGDFTPFGYLDNPYHCWSVHRSGILRSLPGIGFGLCFPAGPGGYFDERTNGIYRAFLRLGFWLGSRRLWSPEDFRDGELTASHHSKNVLTYRVRTEGLDASCSFFLASEDALVARIHFDRAPFANGALRLILAHQYQLGNAKWWGGDGIATGYDAHDDAWVSRSFAAGTVFAIAADAPSRAHSASSAASDVSDWPDGLLAPQQDSRQATAYATAPLRTVLAYRITPELASRGLTVCMTRGANREAALAQLKKAKGSSLASLSEKLADDARFWQNAPRLAGDWPAHWRNGWVYDFETLRMMVRRPIGVYDHQWDAMQIQAPRNVLAETSIDMFALSYADPTTAKSVFLGQFLDALAPNVPCARENGELNMVAADASECGTSISWCYPFHCARSIYQRTADRAWLAALYPHLVRLLNWTLANRADKDDFLFAKCSWESGMDASRRFQIDEPTGAELTEFIRLVELQSAASQAASVLAEFARILGKRDEQTQWNHLRETYATRTQRLWNGRDWFNDFDTRTMRPITNVPRDAGQVGPIFCGVTKPGQTESMLPTLRQFFEDSRDGKAGDEDPMLWSSLMLPYIESLWTARQFDLLADVVHLIANRIYTSMDRRTLAPGTGEQHSPVGWPGVSCEMWGHQGAYGGEGYGWGAVMPAHIIRNLVGVRETPDTNELSFAPNLPGAFMVPGHTYALENLTLCSRKFSVRYAVTGAETLDVTGTWAAGEIQVNDEANAASAPLGTNAFSFHARNRHVYRLIARPSQSANS
jgi:Mannosylglycerate hydrolase MGH1-like glycoside hydrolase domain